MKSFKSPLRLASAKKDFNPCTSFILQTCTTAYTLQILHNEHSISHSIASLPKRLRGMAPHSGYHEKHSRIRPNLRPWTDGSSKGSPPRSRGYSTLGGSLTSFPMSLHRQERCTSACVPCVYMIHSYNPRRSTVVDIMGLIGTMLNGFLLFTYADGNMIVAN